MISFQREEVTESLYKEALPLLIAHYEEIVPFKDIPLEVDVNQYIAMDKAGVLRCFTARKEGVLVGYSNYFVRKHPHFSSSLQALSDILYVSPAYRGFGVSFLQWCEERLKSEGIQQIYQSVTPKHDFGRMLERMGYEKADTQYTKRIN